MNPFLLRQSLGKFATGVAIVTTRSMGFNYGFTANSFTSVSLSPPLVLVCIQEESSFVNPLSQSGTFGVSLLDAGQVEISNIFSDTNLTAKERFERTSFKCSTKGNPMIINALSWIDCQLEDMRKVGDHHICIGRVTDISVSNNTENPLIFYGGNYRSLR